MLFTVVCPAAAWLLRSASPRARHAPLLEGVLPAGRPLTPRRVFREQRRSAEGWSALRRPPRLGGAYRDRWQHDKVVRSTHGVNCTGSCSWKIHVKDGIVTWETQADRLPLERPRDARLRAARLPPRRLLLLVHLLAAAGQVPLRPRRACSSCRAARAEHGDPVEAWASIVETRRRPRLQVPARQGRLRPRVLGRGRRADRRCPRAHDPAPRPRPDRRLLADPGDVDGLLRRRHPLPLADRRRLPHFYDWYADLPPASPQVWGDQTDVPESADWWDAGYLMMWGSNIPMTRTPDAHFMTEARYRGQKMVVVSPDYSDHTKFADDWLPAEAGTDGALAMAMGHVILKEFYVERQVPYFEDYARASPTCRSWSPLDERDGSCVAGALPARLGPRRSSENAEWKPVVLDAGDRRAVVPNGTVGDRWGEEGKGRWNLELGDIDPALTLLGAHEELVEVALPRFDGGEAEGGGRDAPRRAGRADRRPSRDHRLRPARAQLRRRAARACPASGRRATRTPAPFTPAWQEAITGVDAGLAVRVAREFARNAERTERALDDRAWAPGPTTGSTPTRSTGRCSTLVLLCGCQGVNGGGWAHYVGQEKVRTITGWSTLAFALDWSRPPRQQAATPFLYLATDQWRYDDRAGESPRRSAAGRSRHAPRRLQRARRAPRLAALLPDLRPQPAD